MHTTTRRRGQVGLILGVACLAGSASGCDRPEASPRAERTPVEAECRAPDSTAAVVRAFLGTVDTGTTESHALMRESAGLERPGSAGAAAPVEDALLCARAARFYATLRGPDTLGAGVHVFPFGRAYVIDRPNRTADHILLVVDPEFRLLDVWGF